MWSFPRFHIRATVFYYIQKHIVISSELEHFIMFTDDTNLFFKHKDLTTLLDPFWTVQHHKC